jgi:DNA polymerase III delta subunit
MPYGTFQKTLYPLVKARVEAGSALKSMHPFALHKTMVRTAVTSMEELNRSLQHLFAAELALKSTSLSPRTALEGVILRICRR